MPDDRGIFKVSASDRQIVGALGSIGAATLASRVLGFLRDMIVALAFGAGHLPAAAQVWPLDAVVVSRTLLLNGIAGLVFGGFYVRHGLESAIVAHFSADLVLHVAAPLAMA